MMKRIHSLWTNAMLAVLLMPLAGCTAGPTAFQYLPTQPYFRSYERLHGVKVRTVKHVRETDWGFFWLGNEISRPSPRRVVEEALGGNPSYYVSDLNVTTEPLAASMLPGMLFMNIPKVTVEFDVVEILSHPQPGPAP